VVEAHHRLRLVPSIEVAMTLVSQQEILTICQPLMMVLLLLLLMMMLMKT
jgi:hypothetical protein